MGKSELVSMTNGTFSSDALIHRYQGSSSHIFLHMSDSDKESVAYNSPLTPSLLWSDLDPSKPTHALAHTSIQYSVSFQK